MGNGVRLVRAFNIGAIGCRWIWLGSRGSLRRGRLLGLGGPAPAVSAFLSTGAQVAPPGLCTAGRTNASIPTRAVRSSAFHVNIRKF